MYRRAPIRGIPPLHRGLLGGAACRRDIIDPSKPARSAPASMKLSLLLLLLLQLHMRFVAGQVVDCEAEASCAGMAPCCMVRLGPEDQTPEAYAAWRPGFEAWRTRVRAALESGAPRGFAAYDAPAVEWSRSDWVQAKTMLHDRYLFDRETNQWTVQRYLDDLVDRYGGVDSVVPTPSNL